MKVVKKFKTFRDLILRKTSKYDPTLRARLTFDNDYGISMVRDNLLKNRYEIAVLHNNELCFNTSITSDTVKGLTGREVTKLMEKIQKL